MKYHFSIKRLAIASFVGVSLVVMFFFIASQPVASQNGKTTPMTPDGHPDLGGYWVTPPAVSPDGIDPSKQVFERGEDGSILFDISTSQGAGVKLCEDDSCQVPNQPSYTPAFMPRVRAIAKSEFAGTTSEDPNLSCKPGGVPRAGIGNALIIQSPQVIAMIHGDYTDRVIYMDGSPHPADMEPSYMGDSRGHWEGNTLVVDVAGLNDDTWLGGGYGGITIYTSVHSNKEHVVERWTREGDEITYQATVDDPIALTKPWVIAPRKIRLGAPGDHLETYFCDGGGISSFMRDHYVKPDPEDRDIKYHCYTHHCDVPDKKK